MGGKDKKGPITDGRGQKPSTPKPEGRFSLKGQKPNTPKPEQKGNTKK